MGWICNDKLRILQEFDWIGPNASLRLTTILALPQTVSIPYRSYNTPFVDYFKLIIMTSDEFTIALKHKQERQEEIARARERKW